MTPRTEIKTWAELLAFLQTQPAESLQTSILVWLDERPGIGAPVNILTLEEEYVSDGYGIGPKSAYEGSELTDEDFKARLPKGQLVLSEIAA
jgi:hypothetical protein